VDTLWSRLLIFIKSKLFQIDDEPELTLERLIGITGIISFGDDTKHILEEGRLLVQQAKIRTTRGLVCALLEGLCFNLFFF
jgi:hypothetical protein